MGEDAQIRDQERDKRGRRVASSGAVIRSAAFLGTAGSLVALAQKLARSRLAKAGEVFLKLAGALLAGYGFYLAQAHLITP